MAWEGDVAAGDENGQTTGITVQTGDVITIVASGWAYWGSGATRCGPQGGYDATYETQNPKCVGQARTGALIMKIGSGPYIPVGCGLFRHDVGSDEGEGEIKFYFNDVQGAYYNNQGSYHVHLGLDEM